jgi:hypothetical protein
MSKRTPNSFRPGVVELESRDVPSIASVQLANHILTVKCNDTTSTVVVTQSAAGVQVQDSVTGKHFTFALSQVSRVDVFGGAGNDTLTSRGDNVGVRIRLYGEGGNNSLYGGPGREILVGGDGNNKIYGRAGSNDVLMAGNGNNLIIGSKGNNVIQAGNGANTLIGGAGINAITGGSGNNTIVSINGATSDTLDPGSGQNILWIDASGTTTDRIIGQTTNDVVHAVTTFANGASKHLNGGTIPVPATINNAVYEAFTGRPLFASGGPTINDIIQSVSTPNTPPPVLDDSWLLAALGGIVNSAPQIITQNMVDFGDGTYGVALGGFFFRVDNRLPVPPQFGGITPAYAQLGQSGSMWVPILEKVFANYLTATNNYNALNGTGGMNPAGTSAIVYAAFGLGDQNFDLTQFTSSSDLASTIQTALTNGQPGTLTVGVPGGSATLIPNQAYTIVGGNINTQGILTSIIVRNPMGFDGGGSTDSNPKDGLVTVNISDLALTTGTLDFATASG